MSEATTQLNSTVTPHLICKNALEAIEFYKKAFGAEERCKLTMPNGMLMHAGLRIGNSDLMLAEENPQWDSYGPLALKGTPVVIHLVVPDVDASLDRAVQAGATLTMPAADMFWGDRYGQVKDPFGHRWSLATTKKAMTQEEMQQAMLQFMPGDCGTAK